MGEGGVWWVKGIGVGPGMLGGGGSKRGWERRDGAAAPFEGGEGAPLRGGRAPLGENGPVAPLLLREGGAPVRGGILAPLGGGLVAMEGGRRTRRGVSKKGTNGKHETERRASSIVAHAKQVGSI